MSRLSLRTRHRVAARSVQFYEYTEDSDNYWWIRSRITPRGDVMLSNPEELADGELRFHPRPHLQRNRRSRAAIRRQNRNYRAMLRQDGVENMSAALARLEEISQRWLVGWTAVPTVNPPIDRSTWGPGPWDEEPDYVYWEDPATKYRCLARRSQTGNFCGYVGVPEGHLAYGRDYSELPVEVHGGLTFSNEDARDGWWWFGFDCAQSWDLQPALEPYMREVDAKVSAKMGELTASTRYRELMGSRTYRPLEYVRDQVNSLASQLAQIDR